MAVMALAVLTIAPKGCESSTEPGEQSKSKAIEITTITTGEDIDPDGYIVELCQVSALGCRLWHVSANGKRSHSFFGGPYGDHTVELGDVASNCVVSGDNPRVVGIHRDLPPAQTTFEIQCTAIPPEQR
jgi:hypothetical protein